jgi:glycosyltransferase involved in cell wall biosynthesis
MRIVAISRVLNEADIIECFVRHTAAFAAHHVIADDGSSDATIEILSELKREGLPLSVQQSRSISFNESDSLTMLYQQACREHAPDWVLCVDADEFIDDRELPGGLPGYLQQLLDSDSPADLVSMPMVNYAASSHDDPDEAITPRRIRRRQAPSNVPKIIVRASLAGPGACIAHGSHWASVPQRPTRLLPEPRLRLAHYSERSAFQYILKFVRGWSKVLAAGQAEVERRTAYHYQAPFEFLRDRPQDLLRSPHFMGFKNETADLIDDPIDYRGGALRYTPRIDDAMHAVQGLMGFLQDLSLRHGKLLDEFPDVRAKVREWERVSTRIL